jgi:hypothetical protein
MPGPKPNKLHDELDALLDGRPVELTDELAPLVEAADALRAELAAFQLDPEVADRHLERILQGSATVVRMPVRHPPNGWDVRRRLVAVALAAALVLAPATMASAAALPGQAMYPFKLAIEQLRLASVQWSASLEAGERTRVADERLEEVETLVELRMFNQLPDALNALERAVRAARVAVSEAVREGESVGGVVAKLNQVTADGGQVVQQVANAASSAPLPAGTKEAIQAAVAESQQVLPPTPTAAPNDAPTPPPATSPTNPAPQPTSAPTQPPPTNPPDPPPTNPPDPPPTTTAPPTTTPTTAPPPTEDTATPGSGGAPPAGGEAGGFEPPAGPPTTSGATP